MKWKKILAREWLILLGCVFTGLVWYAVLLRINPNSEFNADVILTPLFYVYFLRLLLLFARSIIWAFRAVRKERPPTDNLADAVIIDSPSFIEFQSARARRNKAIGWVIFGIVLIGAFLCVFLPPNKANFDRSKSLPDFSSHGIPAWQPPNTDDRVLPNGTILVSRNLGGGGKLTIENGTSSDAVIKLVSSAGYYLFYVGAKNSFTLPNVWDGDYRVLYESGNDWDGQAFTRNLSCEQFDKTLDFETTRTRRDDGIDFEFTIFKLTLQPVVNGNATTSPISVADFMR